MSGTRSEGQHQAAGLRQPFVPIADALLAEWCRTRPTQRQTCLLLELLWRASIVQRQAFVRKRSVPAGRFVFSSREVLDRLGWLYRDIADTAKALRDDLARLEHLGLITVKPPGRGCTQYVGQIAARLCAENDPVADDLDLLDLLDTENDRDTPSERRSPRAGVVPPVVPDTSRDPAPHDGSGEETDTAAVVPLVAPIDVDLDVDEDEGQARVAKGEGPEREASNHHFVVNQGNYLSSEQLDERTRSDIENYWPNRNEAIR
jgi:hypothetical protein